MTKKNENGSRPERWDKFAAAILGPVTVQKNGKERPTIGRNLETRLMSEYESGSVVFITFVRPGVASVPIVYDAQLAPPPPSAESRSVQRREAAQAGQPAPEFSEGTAG